METVTERGSPQASTRGMAKPSNKAARRWRSSRWGSVFLSIDFLLGLPLGAGFGAFAALSGAVATAIPTILITFVAVDIALAALALAAITLLAALVSPEYLELLQRLEGGVRRVTRPFKIVAAVSGAAAVASLTLALTWPAIPMTAVPLWRAVRWATVGLASFGTFWAIIGSCQLVELGTFHMEKRATLLGIIRDVRRRQQSERRA